MPTRTKHEVLRSSEAAPMLAWAVGYAIALGWLTPQRAIEEYRKFPLSSNDGAALGDKAAAAFGRLVADLKQGHSGKP